MLSKYKWERIFIILFLLFVGVAFAQEKNPTVYPYGGVLDSSRYTDWMKKNNRRVPLNFINANFSGTRFISQVNFNRARFDCKADFISSQFQSMADFHNTIFDSLTEFEGAEFDNLADFGGVQFNSRVYLRFWETEFHRRADFSRAEFDNKADFN